MESDINSNTCRRRFKQRKRTALMQAMLAAQVSNGNYFVLMAWGGEEFKYVTNGAIGVTGDIRHARRFRDPQMANEFLATEVEDYLNEQIPDKRISKLQELAQHCNRTKFCLKAAEAQLAGARRELFAITKLVPRPIGYQDNMMPYDNAMSLIVSTIERAVAELNSLTKDYKFDNLSETIRTAPTLPKANTRKHRNKGRKDDA